MLKVPSKLYTFLLVGAFALLPSVAQAQCTDLSVGGGVNCAQGNSTVALQPAVASVVNVLIAIAGITAVIVIIIGGIKYTLSQGNEKSIESAKNTILYAVIGLIIAILSFAIVNFVLGKL